MNLNTSFCMDVGQVKTGDDKDDTYVKMLQEVVRVTAPIAYGVAAEYPSVVDLVRGFSTKGPMMLENVKVRIALNFYTFLCLDGCPRTSVVVTNDCCRLR